MKDFIQITKDDVLPRLMNDEQVYAFVLNMRSNGITPDSYKLKEKQLGTIAKLINHDNVILFVKKTS